MDCSALHQTGTDISDLMAPEDSDDSVDDIVSTPSTVASTSSVGATHAYELWLESSVKLSENTLNLVGQKRSRPTRDRDADELESGRHSKESRALSPGQSTKRMRATTISLFGDMEKLDSKAILKSHITSILPEPRDLGEISLITVDSSSSCDAGTSQPHAAIANDKLASSMEEKGNLKNMQSSLVALAVSGAQGPEKSTASKEARTADAVLVEPGHIHTAVAGAISDTVATQEYAAFARDFSHASTSSASAAVRPEDPCVCRVCSKRFSSDKGARRHERTAHGGAASIACEDCGATFKRRDKLRRHRREVHGVEGGRRHACEHCGRSYARKERLVAHIREWH